jgi:aminoglycoside 3-N-acetyltransferase
VKKPYTRKKLAQDFMKLGVEAGDMLFIHSSFRSLGPVDEGAGTVVAVLEDVVGPEGLILMPSFNLDGGRAQRMTNWNIESTLSSTVGWLTVFFHQMPGTYRSDHYSHSVSARGKEAQAFVADHLSNEGYKSPWDGAPWGKTYGTNSPMYRAYEANGKLLMLGVDYNSSTYIHLVEVIHWNKRLKEDTAAGYIGLNRPRLGKFWDKAGNLNRGLVGNAQCRLFHIREYVDTLLREVEMNSAPYV